MIVCRVSPDDLVNSVQRFLCNTTHEYEKLVCIAVVLQFNCDNDQLSSLQKVLSVLLLKKASQSRIHQPACVGRKTVKRLFLFLEKTLQNTSPKALKNGLKT